MVIARLDKLSRNEDVQAKLLQASDCRCDLVVCDAAHKFSATIFGAKSSTPRLPTRAASLELTRHFLLMTAMPHNGKKTFFMALLDGDPFEGRFRDAVHAVDVRI